MGSLPTGRAIARAITSSCVVAALAAITVTSCVPVGAFACIDDSECGNAGACEPVGYCSSPDEGCESARRYSRYSPDDLAGRCVMPGDGTGGGTSSDTSTTRITLDGPGETTTTPDETSAAVTTTTESSSDGTSTTGPSSACVPAGRDPATPVLLYDFCEGEGTEVVSITDEPFPLDFEQGTVGAGFEWVEDGLLLNGDWQAARTALRSRERVFEVLDACRDGGEVTVEAWVTPYDDSQGGPTGIVVLGPKMGEGDTLNFGIAMNPDWTVPGYVGVMYTDATLELTWADTPMKRPSHLVLVHEPGLTSLYLDGEVIASMPQGGDLSGWNPNYDLVFGNYSYYDVRNWQGTFHLVAIYCEALDAARIGTNFAAGHRPPA